jgi:hypothetical protein
VLRADELECGGAVRSLDDLMAGFLEDRPEDEANIRIVVDHEDHAQAGHSLRALA